MVQGLPSEPHRGSGGGGGGSGSSGSKSSRKVKSPEAANKQTNKPETTGASSAHSREAE